MPNRGGSASDASRRPLEGSEQVPHERDVYPTQLGGDVLPAGPLTISSNTRASARGSAYDRRRHGPRRGRERPLLRGGFEAADLGPPVAQMKAATTASTILACAASAAVFAQPARELPVLTL